MAGTSINLDVSLTLSGTNTARYNPAFWVGQGGNDPRSAKNPVSLGNGQYDPATVCSGAVVSSTDTIPTPSQFFYSPGDATCADVSTTVVPQDWKILGISVLCQATSATDSNLSVPYVLTYGQNVTGTNTPCSILNVPLGSTSKCNSGTATVNVGTVPLQSGGYIELTKQTVPANDPQSFSFTATAPAGTYMGYATKPSGGTYSAITPVLPGSTPTTMTVSLKHNESARIYMGVTSTARTMTITEAATTGWESTSQISCTNVNGGPGITRTESARSMTASLTATNAAAACTFTNTKSAQITLFKNLPARVNAADQFRVNATVSGTGRIYTSDPTAGLSSISATTSGADTSASTTFYVTPNQNVSLAEDVVSGSGATLTNYTGRLTCTGTAGSYNGTLPSNKETYTGTVQPTPGSALSCTFTNLLPTLTVNKTVSASYLKYDRQASGDFQATPGTLTYTVVVSSANATARTVQVTDTLPAGLKNVTVKDSSGATVPVTDTSGSSLTQPIAGPTTNGTGIRWTAGDLPAGETRTFTVTADLAPLTTAPSISVGIVRNVAAVGAANLVVNAPPSSAKTDVVFPIMKKTVQNVSKSGSTPESSAVALPGEQLEYCITAVNRGSVNLTNYVITDNFPANTTYVPSSAKLTYDSSALSVAMINSGTGISGTIPTLAIDKTGILCFRVTVN